MADLISRLRLESGEFDSKIKRAGQELMAYSEHCKETGSTMGEANKDAKDFAKALGSMQTTSSSARGKINELTEAFVNLKVMYKNMTDEEKNNAFGKNLAASLDQLKTRIDQAKAELNDVNKELGNTKQAEVDTKGGLEGLTSALGINIKTLAGWGTAIAAGKVALDVAKDAFFASESTVDEWGRTVAASQSLYEGFLTAINNGDISGYLSNIDSIVKAARLAYDELDKLGTMKTIQAPQISKQQTENERIRSMIQTGRYIAPQDGRKNAVFNGREMQTGDKLTAGQIRALEKQLQGGMQKVVKLVGNEVDQTGKAINAYYDKLAKTNGMSLQEFKKGTSSWEEFSKKMQGYEQYKEWDKQARTEFAKQGGRGNVDFDKSNPYAEFRKWGTFRVDKEGDNSYKDLVALIQQRDQQVGQVYSTQAQAYRTMNRAEGLTVRKIMGDTGGKGGTTNKNLDDEQKVQQKINELLKEALTADANRQGEIRQQVAELQKQQEKYKDIKNLAQGILPKDKEAVFTIDGQLSEETKKALSDIKGVTIDDRSITVTANTSDALKALQGIEGVAIDPKTVTITATDEALPKLRDIQGVTIDDKTMTVTADTADALRALQGIEGVTIDPKTVTITATDEALPKLRDIQGVTIDDKTMTVTAETADALRALQGIEGVTIAPKSVTITATDEALPKLREIEGVTIDDKTMTITADTQEAMQKVQDLIGQVSTTTLQMKVAPPDLDKLFPDMSKENYNTGYQGSAQAKYDSARVDLAVGPMNFDAINDYIGSIKGMLKDADLGDELYTSMTEKLKDATTVSTLLQEMMERGLAGADLESTAQALKEKLLSPEGIDQTAIQSFLDTLNAQIEEAGGVGLKLNADTGEVTDDKGKDDGAKETFGKFKEFASGLNHVASGLQQMGVQLPKGVSDVLGVVNGVISVIQGISTIIGVFQTSAITANTIALGALTAAVTANTVSNFIPFFSGGGVVPAFAQGGTIPKFADGGLIGRAALGMTIPGNSMSGDNLRLPVDGGRGVIGVNSGEVILNRAQQGNLASQLEGGGMENIDIDWVMRGEDMRAVINNNGRRTGRGEIVQSRRNRS